jgi:hypothetical protein
MCGLCTVCSQSIARIGLPAATLLVRKSSNTSIWCKESSPVVFWLHLEPFHAPEGYNERTGSFVQ